MLPINQWKRSLWQSLPLPLGCRPCSFRRRYSGISGQFDRQCADDRYRDANFRVRLSDAESRAFGALLRGHKATKSLFDRAWKLPLAGSSGCSIAPLIYSCKAFMRGQCGERFDSVLLRCCCTLDSSALRERCSGLFPADSDPTNGSGIPHCRHPTSRRRVAGTNGWRGSTAARNCCVKLPGIDRAIGFQVFRALRKRMRRMRERYTTVGWRIMTDATKAGGTLPVLLAEASNTYRRLRKPTSCASSTLGPRNRTTRRIHFESAGSQRERRSKVRGRLIQLSRPLTQTPAFWCFTLFRARISADLRGYGTARREKCSE